ncbi:MAG: hypothetical protein ACJ8GW_01435 [Massilia sp.]
MKKPHLQKLPCTLFLTLALCSLAQPLQAAQSAPTMDLSIGSYPYFVALSARCGTTPARTAALGRYKTQYVSMLRKGGEMMENTPGMKPADLAKYKQHVAAVERGEPDTVDQARFEAMFAKASPRELAQMCGGFDASMEGRMEVNNMILHPPKEVLPKGKDGQTEPPIRFLSLQHLHALMVSCEKIDPNASHIAARSAAWAKAVPKARSMSGAFRTEVGIDGKYKETEFPNAAAMVKSAEFEVDTKRYLAVVAKSSPSILKNDCASFVEIMNGVGK